MSGCREWLSLEFAQNAKAHIGTQTNAKKMEGKMLNNCQFIGRLGKEVEIRSTQTGSPVASFSIACSESWKDKQGQKQETTEWVSITAFGKLAEICGQYLTKGMLVYVAGKMKTDKYRDANGNDRYTTKIICDEMKMLEKKQGQSGHADVYASTEEVPF